MNRSQCIFYEKNQEFYFNLSGLNSGPSSSSKEASTEFSTKTLVFLVVPALSLYIILLYLIGIGFKAVVRCLTKL